MSNDLVILPRAAAPGEEPTGVGDPSSNRLSRPSGSACDLTIVLQSGLAAIALLGGSHT